MFLCVKWVHFEDQKLAPDPGMGKGDLCPQTTIQIMKEIDEYFEQNPEMKKLTSHHF